MPRYERRDKDGKLTDVFVVSEDTLRRDPQAVIRSVVVKGAPDAPNTAPPAPEGYEHLATMDGDPDGLHSNVDVFVYAKKDAYTKEEPDAMDALRVLKPASTAAPVSTTTNTAASMPPKPAGEAK